MSNIRIACSDQIGDIFFNVRPLCHTFLLVSRCKGKTNPKKLILGKNVLQFIKFVVRYCRPHYAVH